MKGNNLFMQIKDNNSIFELSFSDTARFRTLFIINKAQWDSGTVLLTPALGLYGAEQLQWLRYDQPHLVLNSKEMN